VPVVILKQCRSISWFCTLFWTKWKLERNIFSKFIMVQDVAFSRSNTPLSYIPRNDQEYNVLQCWEVHEGLLWATTDLNYWGGGGTSDYASSYKWCVFVMDNIRSFLFKLVHKGWCIIRSFKKNWTKDPPFLLLWNIPTLIMGPDEIFIYQMQVNKIYIYIYIQWKL
jgi:hypothetical protein